MAQLQQWLCNSKPTLSCHYKCYLWFPSSNVSSFLVCYSCNHINVLQVILKPSRGSVWVTHVSSSTVSTRSTYFSFCFAQLIQRTVHCIYNECLHFTKCRNTIILLSLLLHGRLKISICRETLIFLFFCFFCLSNIFFRCSGYHYLHNPQTEWPGFILLRDLASPCLKVPPTLCCRRTFWLLCGRLSSFGRPAVCYQQRRRFYWDTRNGNVLPSPHVRYYLCGSQICIVVLLSYTE